MDWRAVKKLANTAGAEGTRASIGSEGRSTDVTVALAHARSTWPRAGRVKARDSDAQDDTRRGGAQTRKGRKGRTSAHGARQGFEMISTAH